MCPDTLPAAFLDDLAGISFDLPGGEDYAAALDLWNGALDVHPALVLRPRDTGEVSSALALASEHGVPISVLGGGHDWLGRSVRTGGVVVDLSLMRGVLIEGETAVVGGGALARDLVAAAAPHGLLAATGTAGAVGVAGLTLGGGYGPLLGTAGLAADNLLGAEVVLGDGTIASTDEDPELLWALRGGGGNFGVVTSMRIALHRDRGLIGGMLMFTGDDAGAVLGGCAGLIREAPEELTVLVELTATPDLGSCVLVVPVWSGDPDAGEETLDRVRELGTPVIDTLGRTDQKTLLAGFDEQVPHGMHWSIRTRTVAELTPQVISALLAAAAARPGPGAGIGVRQFHGAAARVAPDATAFGRRDDHLVLEISAGWTSEEDAAPFLEWADHVWSALDPIALPGGYPNFLAPEFTAQVEKAYGDNGPRLLRAKDRYDPRGIFTATPLPR